MKRYNFINGSIIDALSATPTKTNILVENGIVKGLGYLPDEDDASIEVIDIKNKVVLPAVVDAYASVMEPQFEDCERLSQLSESAIQGGVQYLVGVPKAPHDTPEDILHLTHMMQSLPMPMGIVGAITKQKKGIELAEMGLMAEKGAVAFTDTTSPDSLSLFKNALTYSKVHQLPYIVRPTEPTLSGEAVMTSGVHSSILGVKSQPKVAESLRIARDLELLATYGGHIHFFPITTQRSVQLIREAKSRGLQVTCGTAPQYLYFDDLMLEGYLSIHKVSPPYRSKTDQTALIEGIKDGTIDLLASDHLPQTLDDKRTDIQSAGYGVSILDAFVPLIIDCLHHTHGIPLPTLLPLISKTPRAIFGLKLNGIAIGKKANFTILDLTTPTILTPKTLKSGGKNNPFIDRPLQCKVVYNMVNGVLY
jgi:dihydroorotase